MPKKYAGIFLSKTVTEYFVSGAEDDDLLVNIFFPFVFGMRTLPEVC
jgi:hypothetical protein